MDLKAPSDDGSRMDLARSIDLGLPVTCADGVKDGDETDIDCGGGFCTRCLVGKMCIQGTDCLSGKCTANRCAPLLLSFSPQMKYPTGGSPTSVAAGDLDGDGKPDLAITDGIDGILVLLNQGGGAFPLASHYVTSSCPSSVAIRDLDGDGKADLAVVNYNAAFENTLSVLINRGGGVFRPAVNYAVGGKPTSVAAEDLDGDAKPDLVIADGLLFARVMLNSGGTNFKIVDPYSQVGSSPWSIAIGDFNLDGKPDLVSGNRTENSASVLLNKGGALFADAVNYVTGVAPVCVAIGDFNADTKPDIAAANSGEDSFSILLNKGDGSFQPAIKHSVGKNPAFIAVADFDLDGKPDLAIANRGENTVSLLLNQGGAIFQAGATYAAGTEPISISVGDFNSDGKLDLAVANYGGGVSVFLNTSQ